MKKSHLILITLFLAFSATLTLAQTPTTIPGKIAYQGKLLENGVPVNGIRIIDFSIPGTGWTETHNAVSVAKGLYSVQLGSITPIPTTVFSSPTVSLEITVEGTTLAPQVELLSIPYAYKAEKANQLGDVVYIGTGGNVGIGKTDPGTKLDVNGVITAIGGNSSNWNAAYGWSDHSAVGYLTSEVDGSVTNESQTLSSGGNTSPTINLSSAGGSGGGTVTLAASGRTSLSRSGNTITINSSGDGTGTDSQDLALSGNTLSLTNDATTVDLSQYLDNTDTQLTEAQVDAYVADNGYLTSEVDGSVTNESQTLSAGGTTAPTIDLTSVGGVGGGTVTLEASGQTSLSRSGNTITISSSTAGSSLWTANGNDIYYNNGNVGIGKTNPLKPLEVSGDAIIDGNLYIKDIALVCKNNTLFSLGFPSNFDNNMFRFFTGNPSVEIRLGHINGNKYGFYMNERNDMSFASFNKNIDFYPKYYDAIPTLRISSSGNVGIGITSPARKLHVNDIMRLEPRSSAPSNPAEGDIYMDSTTHKLRCFDGTKWNDLF